MIIENTLLRVISSIVNDKLSRELKLISKLLKAHVNLNSHSKLLDCT